MKEYIEREAALRAIGQFKIGFRHNEERCAVDGCITEIMKVYPADVVSKVAYDQVAWERDVAIQQLREDYGVGLGEKKAADVVERKRGEWIEVSYWKYKNGHSIHYTAKRCSVCGADVGKKTQYNGCPFCFADMREVDHAD